MTSPGPILLAYDGSEDAQHAIEHAAALRPGADVVVIYVRQPLEGLAGHLEGHPALEEVGDIDAAARDGAERLAAEGAERAREAGLDAAPRVASATEAAADTIVRVADELDASLIVVGSRGRRRIASLVLGSVSHNVVHQTGRPVLIVPSPSLAAARAHLAETTLSA